MNEKERVKIEPNQRNNFIWAFYKLEEILTSIKHGFRLVLRKEILAANDVAIFCSLDSES